MSNDVPASPRRPDPDDAHEDGLLMHELTVVNTLLGRYVLRFLDADSGLADPIPPTDELALADRVARAAEAIRARATCRAQTDSK
jgi:hypothetical protein